MKHLLALALLLAIGCGGSSGGGGGCGECGTASWTDAQGNPQLSCAVACNVPGGPSAGWLRCCPPDHPRCDLAGECF